MKFGSQRIGRRSFLLGSAFTSAVAANSLSQRIKAQAPAIITSDKLRPTIPYGVACGDITNNRATIWSRCDRPARTILEYSTDESFRNLIGRVAGPVAVEDNDFTVKVNLANLPPGEQIFYRVTFRALNNTTISSPATGTFRTAPPAGRDVRFVWSGDNAGQGWGINPEFGGMRIFETMRQLNPDFFIHSGDTIYADNPIVAEVNLDDGSIWRNITTLEKSKVAETLAEFRGNYIYNLLDDNVRRFNAQVPQLVQWDDHETTNNWYPGEILTDVGTDARYTIKDVNVLSARARQAFLEYQPIRFNPKNPQIYRSFQYGPMLDIFMLDERSYRGSNSNNRQTQPSQRTAFLGKTQIAWLKQQLLTSRATWKVIASDMPIGLIVPDGSTAYEALANGDNGRPLGRELEFADLFQFIQRRNIRNVVWITADVHYAAAHYYDPSKAQFTDFHPFWEFVAGPLNAGTFGPNTLDNTFGPQVMFNSLSLGTKPNRPPSEGLQFFGMVKIDGNSKVMTVSLHNLAGQVLYSIDLSPDLAYY